MRQSQSAVMERGFELERVHETEPFEVAWAGEARGMSSSSARLQGAKWSFVSNLTRRHQLDRS